MAEQEQEYDLTLVVTTKGYGTMEAKRKEAATVKRILEVKMQKPLDVFMEDPSSGLTMELSATLVDWPAPGLGSVE